MPNTLFVKIDADKPDRLILKKAGNIAKKGGLVIFPTETVYGLGANYFDEDAVNKIYEIKNRPRNKPFTVHISDISMIKNMGCIPTKLAEALIKKYWPGPLTIILNNDKGEKIGFRMPKHNVALGFIEEAGVPIIAPSANLSGEIPPVNAEMCLKDFDGKVDMILDGGETCLKIESTVVDVTETPYKILREGAILKKEIDSTA